MFSVYRRVAPAPVLEIVTESPPPCAVEWWDHRGQHRSERRAHAWIEWGAGLAICQLCQHCGVIREDIEEPRRGE